MNIWRGPTCGSRAPQNTVRTRPHGTPNSVSRATRASTVNAENVRSIVLQRRPVPDPIGVGDEARIKREIQSIDRCAKLTPQATVRHGDHQRAIPTLQHLTGRDL